MSRSAWCIFGRTRDNGDRMNQQPLQEFTLRDFRCFREQQTARLAPLTLLVGENSTGKTSFLAAVRAMLQVGSYHEDPDFRAPPL